MRETKNVSKVLKKPTANIVLGDRVIYEFQSPWAKPEAKFDIEAKGRILEATGRELIAKTEVDRFWNKAERACEFYANASQFEERASPKEYQTARFAAEKMKIAMKPLLNEALRGGEGGTADLIPATFFHLQQMIELFDEFGLCNPSIDGKKNQPATIFISKISDIFVMGFGLTPATTTEGPFARFVHSCLNETSGLTHSVSPDWVQKYVRQARQRVGQTKKK